MNVSSLKTPGVYINEIDAFPPSVAPVETAIPAFVGYTQKGTNSVTRIKSFMDFESIFGGAPTATDLTVELEPITLAPKETTTASDSKFKLYNSMRLFYENGGGLCYVVSIGNYDANIVEQKPFTDGLDKLLKFDEPTLLLFPDAINLSVDKLGLVQQHALKQCGDLLDRFAILDVQQGNTINDTIFTDCATFRDKISTESLKYGAAYYPYLQSSYSYNFRFDAVNDALGAGKDFKSIYPTDESLKTAIDQFDFLKENIDTVNTSWTVAAGVSDANNMKKLVMPINDAVKIQTSIDKIFTMLKVVLGDPESFTNVQFSKAAKDIITGSLKDYVQNIVDFKSAYEKLRKADNSAVIPPLANLNVNDANFKSVWGVISTSYPQSNPNLYDTILSKTITPVLPAVPYDTPDFDKIQLFLQKLHASVINTMDAAVKRLNDLMLFEENRLVSRIPIYPAIIAKLSATMNIVPPSGAMAGIYARTDNNRGVWISPANKGINGIISLTADINDSDQEDMNISDTGKSINALRKFSGKGFMVWGGRTLAGNSNDWRYVNVRRLANMIEESVKKACMQYVFEPNVSQTWVSVKGMIDNFMTTLWKDGALAGKRPEDAFFVTVGLNETMSALDVLEGRLIVKIGYAASHPAEFIILEFKQTQQRS
ncbi:phage tail sheath C-terminal domain-containing protein [Flavobacterium sp.]|uniref:phage tail sheath C-terminal domain-containing protein n=1 Tax=Flavobacterium sp. TaxID=239 RepID=UPI00286BB8A3|nr:phage tail sheath C-terminal domain-containing protein [Flavobacterium sp.]